MTTATEKTIEEQHKEAKQRYTALQLQDRRLTQRIAQIQADMASAKVPHSPGLRKKAMALLTGQPPEAEVATAEYEVEYQRIIDERRSIREAIPMQRKIMDELHYQMSRIAAADAVPEHRELVREIVKKLVPLCAACDAEKRFREDLFLRDVEYTSHIRPMPIQGLDLVHDKYSLASRYIREVIEYGFVTAKECRKLGVPEKLVRSIEEILQSLHKEN